jgi:flagellar L-ring protein precursor FlgH
VSARTTTLRACAAIAACALAGCASRFGRPDFAPSFPEDTAAPTIADGAIYHEGHDISLFENAIAHRVGDMVTIRLQESTSASKSAVTTTKKTTSATLPGPTVAGRPVTVHGTEILSGGISNDSKFDGEGTSAQSNTLTGNITVTVARRLSNGNLVVRGEKWLALNQGKEFVRIQGIVRPIDIEPDNSLPSYKVADARISYGGKGAINDANAPGLLSRFFNSPLMPF